MSILLWIGLFSPIVKLMIGQRYYPIPRKTWIIPNVITVMLCALSSLTHYSLALGLIILWISVHFYQSGVRWWREFLDIAPYVLFAFCFYTIGENAFSFLSQWIIGYTITTILAALIILFWKREQAV